MCVTEEAQSCCQSPAILPGVMHKSVKICRFIQARILSRMVKMPPALVGNMVSQVSMSWGGSLSFALSAIGYNPASLTQIGKPCPVSTVQQLVTDSNMP